MKTLLKLYKKHKKSVYLFTGWLLSALFMVPFLLLGKGSIVTYHDQLDGELLNYILAAKYLFTDIRIYPEIMNGLPAAGAVPPAPLFVLLYVFFKPFTAFMFSQWIVFFAAFSGMYLLLLKLTGREFISFAISAIFMTLPFYPVYGLCIPGQPLLFYAVLTLYQNERLLDRRSLSYYLLPLKLNMKVLLSCLLIILYGICSSPVLAGFACLIAIGIFALLKTVTAFRSKTRVPLSPFLSFALLLSVYCIANFDLIKQVLFPFSAYVSHKSELVISPLEPFSNFREILSTGINYAQSYHRILFFLFGLCLFLFLLKYMLHLGKTGTVSDRLFFKSLVTLFFIFMICLFSAFYHGNFMTELRNASSGILKTFNLDRICWLLPTAWCIFAAYLLAYTAAFVKQEKDSAPLWKVFLAHSVIFAVLGIWGVTVLFHSALRPNLSKLLKGGNYYAMDWNNFFAEDIFIQIDEAIGKPKESYRVISVGIYPAAAAYNGFYCLDGYSNNYPLNYKHTFRRIIEKELEKNDYVRSLFDVWGNRCYVTTAEQANYYTFEKKWGCVVYDLNLNLEMLEKLNCQYIFSAAYLMNAEEKGLSLLRETPFETENSWYHIYVYKIAKS